MMQMQSSLIDLNNKPKIINKPKPFINLNPLTQMKNYFKLILGIIVAAVAAFLFMQKNDDIDEIEYEAQLYSRNNKSDKVETNTVQVDTTELAVTTSTKK